VGRFAHNRRKGARRCCDAKTLAYPTASGAGRLGEAGRYPEPVWCESGRTPISLARGRAGPDILHVSRGALSGAIQLTRCRQVDRCRKRGHLEYEESVKARVFALFVVEPVASTFWRELSSGLPDSASSRRAENLRFACRTRRGEVSAPASSPVAGSVPAGQPFPGCPAVTGYGHWGRHGLQIGPGGTRNRQGQADDRAGDRIRPALCNAL
jgi:hypothetical protein